MGRSSIATSMIVIAVAAANIAAIRSTVASERVGLLVGVALIVLAMQVGTFRLVCGCGGVRRFWLGFVASGLMTSATVAWAEFSPRSAAAKCWRAYYAVAGEQLDHLPGFLLRVVSDDENYAAQVTTVSMLAFLPQALSAFTAGLVARRLWPLLTEAIRRPKAGLE